MITALAVAVGVITTVAGDTVPMAAAPEGLVGVADSAEAAALRAARQAGRPVRVDHLTSATTEVWALPDGQFQAELSAGPVRVRRDDGWVPVDLTLRRGVDGSVAPVAHPNDLRLVGARPTGTHELAAVGVGGKRVAMRWTGALPEPVLDGARATYVDVLPGVDLVVDATRLGFSQSLVVKHRAAVRQVERIRLSFSGPGARKPTRGKNGAIDLRDASGDLAARIPPLLMWDSQKTTLGAPARTKSVTSVLDSGADGFDLTLTPDLGWMRDRATLFPVTVDPTINPVSTTFDTYVRQDLTNDQGGQPDLQIGLLPVTPPAIARSFLSWDTTALTGKQITAATVSFFNYWSHTCTPQSWEIWTTGGATADTRWSNQPAWKTREATSTSTHGSTSCADAWATIDGKSFFQRAADVPGSTRGFMGIRATDETTANGFKQFRSRNGPSSAEVPKATVTYNSYPTVTARSTVPATACATGSARPLVNTLTPQLRATVSAATARRCR